MLKLSVNLPRLKEIDFVCRIVRDAGFDGLDTSFTRFWGPDAIRGGIISETAATEENFFEGVEEYRVASKKYGLPILQTHAPYPAWVTDETVCAQLMKALQWSIRATAELGCRRLVLHPVNVLPEPEDNWAKTVEVCEAMIPELKKTGVTICLENVFRHRKKLGIDKLVGGTTSDYATAAKKIDELNGKAGECLFGYCLDTGHALLLGLDVKDMILTLGSRLKALHIHDNNGMNDQHLLPYVGGVDWNRFTEALAQVGYSDALSFETHGAWNAFDVELMPSVEKLIVETGRMFARRIEERRK